MDHTNLSNKFKTMRRVILHFLLSEYVTTAWRVTLSIVLPVWVLFRLGGHDAAITVGLGALLTSLPDIPGVVRDKRNILICSILLLFMVCLLTGFVMSNYIIMGAVVFLLCFIFSMFHLYGSRMAIMGSTAIVMMIFVIGFQPKHIVQFSTCIALGGIWYLIGSMLQARLFPFRSARHALGECIEEVASFLNDKAAFYDDQLLLEDCFRQIISRHVSVSEKQEQLRDVVLRNRSMTSKGSKQTTILIAITTEIIDLYEQVMAIHYDYEAIRNAFKGTGILEDSRKLINLMAYDLKHIGMALRSGLKFKPQPQVLLKMKKLRSGMQKAKDTEIGFKADILKKLLNNIDEISLHIQNIHHGFKDRAPQIKAAISEPEYKHFVSVQEYSLKKFKDHFTFRSPVFRFSIRMAIVCLFGYIIIQTLPLGNNSYWVLLTITFVMRPGFSLTKKRYFERLVGTVVGILSGFIMVLTIISVDAQLVLIAVFLLGYLSFLRINYAVSVMFITPLVILGLNVSSADHHINFIMQRFYDTLIGCTLALVAAYLFPFWESQRIGNFMKEVLRANINYLETFYDRLSGMTIDITAYKLSRKDVYISMAALSAAFQRMSAEPGKNEVNIQNMYSFQVFNHLLFSTTSAFISAGLEVKPIDEQMREMHIARQAIDLLKNSMQRLSGLGNTMDKIDTTLWQTDPEVNKNSIDDRFHVILRMTKQIHYVTLDMYRHLTKG